MYQATPEKIQNVPINFFILKRILGATLFANCTTIAYICFGFLFIIRHAY